MSQLRLSFLLFITIFSIPNFVEPAGKRPGRHSRSESFIVASCRSTRYPALCIRCLSNATLQTPQQLAQYALSVSLYRALYTRAYLNKVASELKGIRERDSQAVKDCLSQIDDGVDQLSQSIRELRRLYQAESSSVLWHISNVETWVSAALTDATTCVDEFSGGRSMGKLKATIKGKVLNVAQVTSNALALFQRFAARYRVKKP